MIPLQQIEEMFAHVRTETTWDIDGEMLWGYFFTDLDPDRLDRAAQHLVHNGFRFVSIYKTDDKGTYFLHVERVEKHTPASLYARNAEFYRLADHFGLGSYDGMDIGPAERQTGAEKLLFGH